MRNKSVTSVFLRHFRACTKRQAIRVWPHSEIFAGRRPAKMLVGELPKPAGLRDKLSQSPGASACWMRPGLTLLGLIFPPVRMAEQIINVCLDRNGLPHIRLGFAVLGIEGLFLFGELPALLFQRVHFWELRPA